MIYGEKKKINRTAFIFTSVGMLLFSMIFIAINVGTIDVSLNELFNGLFIAYDEKVATVYDLRFPRIIISIIVGGSLALSGTLLQAVLKNPLTDPGIIGISGGASLGAIIVTGFMPQFITLAPLAGFAGGLVAFFIVYLIAFDGGLNPLKILLVGIAVSIMLGGISEGINAMSGGQMSTITAIVEGSINMKTWSDVILVLKTLPLAMVVAMVLGRQCNLMEMDDASAKAIGVSVNKNRLFISVLAVFLASIGTAVVGSVSFVGLIVPHIGRILVGNNHKVLLPFSILAGGTIFFSADTIGRIVVLPYEINPSIIMSVIGGLFFIFLLKGSKKYGN